MIWLLPLGLILLLATRGNDAGSYEAEAERQHQLEAEQQRRAKIRQEAIARRKAEERKRAQEQASQDKFFKDTRNEIDDIERNLDKLKKDISELNGEDPRHL